MPENYKHWPKCRYKDCPGKMYVDKYRLNKGEKDHPPMCKDDCLPYPHCVTTPQCRHHIQYTIERNRKPRSKHSPIPVQYWVPF